MAEERVKHNFFVSNVESSHQPTYSTDFFRFDVTAILRKRSNPQSRLMRISTMFETSIYIHCDSFFEHDQNFLWLYLGEFASPYFTPQNLAEITTNLIPKVKQLFGISDDFSAKQTEIRRENIPVVLDIILDVYPNEERRIGQEIKTIPASNEAILSLKAYSFPKSCCICMERFHDDLEEGGDNSDDVKVSTMACGHIFHYNCIVKWLQTSHVCPLCRYAMPT